MNIKNLGIPYEKTVSKIKLCWDLIPFFFEIGVLQHCSYYLAESLLFKTSSDIDCGGLEDGEI